ncbi:MAG: DUF4190 domain-containing protein [Anaerolineaceae bacterium]|jgi:hypothetical protein
MTTPEINTTPPAYPTLVKRESTLAIISLISGILGWTIFPFIASIVAVITGHLAKKEIRESGGTMSGDGMALAGIILGYTMIGLALLGIIIVVVALLVFMPLVTQTTGSLNGFSPFGW